MQNKLKVKKLGCTSEWPQWPIDTRFGGEGWGGDVEPKFKIIFFGYLLVSEILIKNC